MSLLATYNFPVCFAAASATWVRCLAMSPDGNWAAASSGLGNGLVKLYQKGVGDWDYVTTLTVAFAYDTEFGYSMSFNQDASLLFIGLPYWGDSSNRYGAVQVYSRSGLSWSLLTTIYNPEGNVYRACFGYHVAISADSSRLVVGSGVSASYRIWTLTRVGQTNEWAYNSKLSINNYGWSSNSYALALNPVGTKLLLGNPWVTVSALNVVGSITVYSWSGSNWVKDFEFSPDPPLAYEYFGRQIAWSSDERFVAVASAANYSPYLSVGEISIFELSETAASKLYTFIGPQSELQSGMEFGREGLAANGVFTNLVIAPYRDTACSDWGAFFDYTLSGLPAPPEFWTEELRATESELDYG